MADQTISFDAVTIGQEVTVWFNRGNNGQGGRVTGKDGGIDLLAPGDRQLRWELSEIARLSIDAPLPAEDCLDYSDDCSGPVELWTTGTSMRAWPRCTHHRDKRWDAYDKSIERYADSDVAPSWFDPTIAGERWEDD